MARPNGLPPNARRGYSPTGYTIWVVGDDRAVLRDAYHTYLQLPWWASLLLICAAIFTIDLVYAVIYLIVGGLHGVRDGSFFDALSFSVQTLHTIGYGVMSPASGAANAVMMIESMTGVIVIALATGLVFAKFSRATARVAFSQHAVITNYNGQPHFMFRLGNRRTNVIVQAQLSATASFTEVTSEGQTFYRAYELKLLRDRMSGMRRGWTAMHAIDDDSPFKGLDAAGLAKAEVEIEVSVVGLDSVTVQTVHSNHLYNDKQIIFGHRFADTRSPLDNGDMLIDLSQFDTTVPDGRPAGPW
jgi:inward rectifier potassium channel